MNQKPTRRDALILGAAALAGGGLNRALCAKVRPKRQPSKTALMIHGAGGGGWEYEKWRPVWERAGYRVIARDLMPAPGGLGQTTLAHYVRQVINWTPERENVVLVGASMGGVLALMVAQHIAPSALLLVNSVAPLGVDAGTDAARAKKPRHPPIVRWANGPLQESRDSMPDSDEATILRAWKRWRDESGAVMDALSVGVSVPKPHCPTLAVLGEKDTDIPAATGLALAKWASADVMLYGGMSHVGPLLSTRAAEVAEQAAQWCRKR